MDEHKKVTMNMLCFKENIFLFFSPFSIPDNGFQCQFILYSLRLEGTCAPRQSVHFGGVVRSLLLLRYSVFTAKMPVKWKYSN